MQIGVILTADVAKRAKRLDVVNIERLSFWLGTASTTAVIVALARSLSLRAPVGAVVLIVSATLPYGAVFAALMLRHPRRMAALTAEQAGGKAGEHVTNLATLFTGNGYARLDLLAEHCSRVHRALAFLAATQGLITSYSRLFDLKQFVANRALDGRLTMRFVTRATAKIILCVRRQADKALEYLATIGTCVTAFLRHNKALSQRAGCLSGAYRAPRKGVFSIPRTGILTVSSRRLQYSTFLRVPQPFSALGGGKWLLP